MKTQDFAVLPMEGFVRAEHFRHLLGAISRSTFFDLVREGRIPRPVKIGARAAGWPVGQVREVITRIATGQN